jgi:hypothetical protein
VLNKIILICLSLTTAGQSFRYHCDEIQNTLHEVTHWAYLEDDKNKAINHIRRLICKMQIELDILKYESEIK